MYCFNEHWQCDANNILSTLTFHMDNRLLTEFLAIFLKIYEKEILSTTKSLLPVFRVNLFIIKTNNILHSTYYFYTAINNSNILFNDSIGLEILMV